MAINSLSHNSWLDFVKSRQISVLQCCSLLRDEDVVVFDPADLIGKQLHFQLHVPAAHNLLWITNDNSRGSYVK